MQKFNFRSNTVTLLGDTHDTSVTKDIIATRVQEGGDIIHLGDGGYGFGPPTYAIDNALSWLKMINKVCNQLDITLYQIRGNHDNTSLRIWDAQYSNIVLINKEAYGIFPNGKSALLLSGGVSIDRCVRTANKDYWYDEGTHPIENVENVDIVFSHDCPEQFNHSSHTIPTHWKMYNDKDDMLYQDCIKQRAIVGDIVKRSNAKTLLYGHFHNNITQQIDGVYARCIDINELFFFDADREYNL
jgi:predicted phosphodiesterase